MKLHKRIGPFLVPRVGPWLLRILGGTWRLAFAEGGARPSDSSATPLLYCFWHGDLLVPMFAYRGSGVTVLVSGHRDGAMLGIVLRRLGFGTVSGSITRGGAAALRGLLGTARAGRHLCVPPDGPKGPRGVVKKGVVFLASRARIPIVPAGIAASSSWRATSWDRMVIPKPFARVMIHGGTPMTFPPDLDGEALDRAALDLQAAIDEARSAAARAIGAPRIDAAPPRPASSATGR